MRFREEEIGWVAVADGMPLKPGEHVATTDQAAVAIQRRMGSG
jgi:hypothetical protein